MLKLIPAVCLLILFAVAPLPAEENKSGGENASNPLSKTKNTDLRWQHIDTDSGRINDISIDGAFMASPKLKVKYELHYWETDVTGESRNDFESAVLKGIYFLKEGARGNLKYRVAVGTDWILDLGDTEKGIGSGSDQIGPFAGLALGVRPNLMIVPLVQQFLSYSGENVNTTAFRLISLSPLPRQMWLKLDGKLPVDWENDEAIPATLELQLGKNISEQLAFYLDGLAGIGGDKPYDLGLGMGIRLKY